MIDEKMMIQESVAKIPRLVLEALTVEPSLKPDLLFRPDAIGTLVFDDDIRIDACFEIAECSTLAAIENHALQIMNAASSLGLMPILVASFFSESKQRFLRDSGIGYIDMAGNAWIISKGVFLDRCVKKPSQKPTQVSQFRFSDKATLVIRMLFSGASLGVRQISALLKEKGFQLTPGYVSKTVASLMQDQYAIKEDSGKVRLIRRNLLLEDWTASYVLKARRQPVEGWYYPEADMDVLARLIGNELVGSGALTDRSGASFVDPYAPFDTVDILLKDHPSVVEKLYVIGAEPVDRGANINLHTPAYPVSSFFGVHDVQGVPIVSDLQLYLDLRCQPKRGQEAADHLYDRILRSLLEEEQ